MLDLFQAIEQLSALLALRIEHAARRRGWATRPMPRMQGVGRGQMVQLVSTSLNLPRGEAASFVPRPEPDGERWHIDIRRSDGVLRKSWSEGVQVGRLPSGSYALLRGGAPLSDEAIESWLEDLSKPGPQGVALWVRKVWGIRFGRMSVDVSDLIERVSDADLLDQIHGAVLRATDRAEAEAAIQRIVA